MWLCIIPTMSRSVYSLAVFAFIIGIYCKEANGKCWKSISDLGKNAPLLINSKNELEYRIINGSINIDEGLLKAVCASDWKMDYSLSNICTGEGKKSHCDNENVPYLWSKSAEDGCFNQGVIKHISFGRIDSLIKYITVCYSYATASAIYTSHFILGSAIQYKFDETIDSPMSSLSTVKAVHQDCVYKGSHQFGAFTQQLGSRQLAKKYITFDRLLIPAQLSPTTDAIFPSWQYGSFYYVNTAPQWKQINEGNWAKVEELVREKAIDLQEKVEVWTGVFQILSLPNDDDKNIELYLEPWAENKLLPIPKWFWKIIRWDYEAIAFLTLNYPLEEKPECPCEDICGLHGWNKDTFKTVDQGFTCCCDIKEFLQVTKIVLEESSDKHLSDCRILKK